MLRSATDVGGSPPPHQQPRSLRDLVRAQAVATPRAVAILAPQFPPLTYAALDAQIDALGASLAAFGIRGQDRVAVMVDNGPRLAVGVLGTSCYAVAAPLSPLTPAPELRRVLQALEPRAILLQASVSAAARDVATELGIRVVEFASSSAWGGWRRPRARGR